ncbi:FlaA1/EpsC-like NDP-sugar epimerase [Chryseobacterium bernardetii]|jgi:FlaA1/EpsC-like NDP-sugar epimerase|uniref:FlaA1/EpsC-like NDP-sugar epimerase n=3 Tax=Chryseobacterium TaxID=59732 RepID=A0A543EMR6_9FLAO|nr:MULTISPECIES: nucleoside-diphosphate sugar epimerase/dehydratase [Chryseobacterium]MDR6369267.1 FlaA1/EpsC-like NDP-sugar epimerase [Chryseobacterium vietnamense]MDR6439811.1 FlaA1/EpsC-like NDP-sugar epimerase [Chryseobacterium bernardetii]MDR6459406.1 FlaA1/EpsC-like NDP-sugar epimerase [Chryseobacterium vietnamense]MDR6487574.1 FlaA1/EpsC-like NDP-sugar epimerase [Chryseobacterium vietnamense]TQM22870.1 FlaA1/EpsC-like NDP-sugar epimerase [Chryseobacterium aquifrigidense]
MYNSLRKTIFGGDNVVNLSDVRYLPRWIILVIDIIILVISLFLSTYIIAKITKQEFIYHDDKSLIFAFIILVNAAFMYAFKTYAGIIRHSTFIDLFKLLISCFCTMLAIGTINICYFWITGSKFILTPYLMLYFVISFMGLFLFRLYVKEFFHIVREYRRSALKKRILVLGIDEQSIAIARAILDNPSLPYQVVGFLTQRTDSKSASLLGKPIYGKEKIEENTKEDLIIDGVLIVKEMMARDEMNTWVNLFLEKDLNVFKAPSVQKLRDSDLGGSIRNLQIEDLLNRKPIKIQNEKVKSRHFDKTVLVTGGAGSIGSEIVRQVALFNPSLIVVLDQAETPLYEIELEMREKFPNIAFKFVLGDVSNHHRMESLFQTYHFSMVYHAAAYKHVPLVEENPHEAIFVNILGSKIVAKLSSKYKVNRFVMVSTDKAVNPTNVMGASKRAAELFVQSLQNVEGNVTKFITTRFGNVLGSNGSVIPHFKKQIEAGGPVTITHPEIVRYFMTIPEACELVLQAGTMGEGGEIFVFDMGEPVKIIDLAKRMIKLSGFEPNIDIKIIYTGLRPGEKLYEELLSDDAKTLPTHNDKIMISKDPSMGFEDIDKLTKEITKASLRRDKVEVVRILKTIVPEFRSNNSIYEALDK